jgi:hypothetical protein
VRRCIYKIFIIRECKILFFDLAIFCFSIKKKNIFAKFSPNEESTHHISNKVYLIVFFSPMIIKKTEMKEKYTTPNINKHDIFLYVSSFEIN